MQRLPAHSSRDRALNAGVWILALALFVGICRLGKGATSVDQRAESDECLHVARQAVAQKGLAVLPGTHVSVAVTSGAARRQSDGENSCRAVAEVQPPNTEVVARYDMTLTATNGPFVLKEWHPE
jgi:hypothetical protein